MKTETINWGFMLLRLAAIMSVIEIMIIENLQ